MATSLNITNPSRRHMLGAAFAVPGLALALPALANPASRAQWERLKTAHASAYANMKRFGDGPYRKAANDHDKLLESYGGRENLTAEQSKTMGSHRYWAMEEQFDGLVDDHSAAMSAMLTCPAPDGAALRHKLEIIIREDEWECTGFDAVMGCLLNDVRRLAKGA